MVKFLPASICVALLAATPAFAGNPEPAPADPVPAAAPPLSDWTGFYIGAQAGFVSADAEDGGLSFSGDDNSGGFRAGYDYDLGQYVLGAFAQIDKTDIDLTATRIDRIQRIGARLGYDAGAALYYGAVGAVKADTTTLGDADGYFFGVGYERVVVGNVSVGFEVLHHEFDDIDLAPTAEGSANSANLSINLRF